MDINCTFAAFWTPLRFVWRDDDSTTSGDYISWIKAGPGQSQFIPRDPVEGIGGDPEFPWDSYGLGSLLVADGAAMTLPVCFSRPPGLIASFFMRHPDDQESLTDIQRDRLWYSGNPSNDRRSYGLRAVQLPALTSRFRTSSRIQNPTGDEYEVPVDRGLRLPDLVAQMMEYKGNQERDWFTADRFIEYMKQRWGTKVTENAERRPYMIDHHEQWLSGYDVQAVDGASLGSVSGAMAAGINHTITPFHAPEHGTLTIMACLRPPPLHEDEQCPWVNDRNLTYERMAGDPAVVAARQPEDYVQADSFSGGSQSLVLGQYPAGTFFRQGWNAVDRDIARRDSFPIARDKPGSADAARYVPDYDHAFHSLSQGHARFILNFEHTVDSPIPEQGQSIFIGGRG